MLCYICLPASKTVFIVPARVFYYFFVSACVFYNVLRVSSTMFSVYACVFEFGRRQLGRRVKYDDGVGVDLLVEVGEEGGVGGDGLAVGAAEQSVHVAERVTETTEHLDLRFLRHLADSRVPLLGIGLRIDLVRNLIDLPPLECELELLEGRASEDDQTRVERTQAAVEVFERLQQLGNWPFW